MEFMWLIGGFIILMSEFFLPSFEVFFFGAGALLTGLLTWLVPGIGSSLGLQIGIWLGSSVLTLGLLRKRFGHIFKGKTIDANEQALLDAGQEAEVSKLISPTQPGRIKLHGTTWEARSFDETLEPGQKVSILKQEGMVYYVTKSFNNDEDTFQN